MLKNEQKAIEILLSPHLDAGHIAAAQVYALLAIAEAIYESTDHDSIAKAITELSGSVETGLYEVKR